MERKKNNSPFYFIHSYKINKTKDKAIIANTTYGDKFISFVEKDNIYGSQFHPEKSHYVGLKLLKNFWRPKIDKKKELFLRCYIKTDIFI